MEIWQAIVLGAVQGFAEFLPISSSGHLILLQTWFNVENNLLFYSVMLHLGTLIPVCIVFYKEILELFTKPKTLLFLVIATIPAGIVGLIFNKIVDLDNLFADKLYLLAIAFLITAGLMYFSERRSKKVELLNGITYKTSIIMGLGQAVGVFPGVSRSGSTITFSTIAKVKKEDTAKFTFLMSIPIILAAMFLSTYNIVKEGNIGEINFIALLLGIITASITGYIAIKFMLKVIKKANYKWFSLYLIAISIATLVTYFVR